MFQQAGRKLVENRPGSGTVVATEAVSRAAPDGNTVLFMANSFVINSHLRKLNYDPLTSFDPVCHLTNSPQVIAVNASSPHKTLADLINAAKAKPGELSLASVGPATAQHIGAEMFQRATGTKFVYVPFPGGAPAVTALLGNHIVAVLQNYAEMQESLKDGRLRALATTSPTRIEPRPTTRPRLDRGLARGPRDRLVHTVDHNLERQRGVLARAGNFILGRN